MTSAPVNTWYGLVVTGGHVTQLNLPNNKLQGSIANISGLTYLTGINLSGNLLNILPLELTTLPNLTSLNVNYNKICTGVMESSVLTFVNMIIGNSSWQTTQNNSACPTPTDDIVTIPATSNTGTITTEFITKGYQNGIGALQNSPGSYVGTKRIRTEFSNGQVLIPFTMQSTGSTGKIEISAPANLVVKKTDGTPFLGILNNPITKATSQATNNGLSNILSVVEFGNDQANTPIYFKNTQ